MTKSFCNVSLSPVRMDCCEASPQISQILYGESVIILDLKDGFANIQWLQNETGWMDARHLTAFSEEYLTLKAAKVVSNNFEIHDLPEGKMLLSLGAEILQSEKKTEINFTGEHIVSTALEFLNVPYLSGGRSFFGVDAAGFIQLVFKVNNISLPRNLDEMSKAGESLFFVGESEAGDIAFFSNDEGEMVHAGIMLNSHEIIHADEKVRIDTIDSTGIYSSTQKKHTFLLRVVQRIF